VFTNFDIIQTKIASIQKYDVQGTQV